MKSVLEYEKMLSTFSSKGVRIVKTEMVYKDKTVKFQITVPSDCSSIASEFKTDVMSFYLGFEVTVKAKEV